MHDETILVIVGSMLSIIGCISIIVSYAAFRTLRNLFYRITLYHAIVEAIQALGLMGSTIASDQSYCMYLANGRIYGAMASLIFSLIQLHQLTTALHSFKAENQQMVQTQYLLFKSLEHWYILLGFVMPFLFIQVTLWSNLINTFGGICYLYTDPYKTPQVNMEIKGVQLMIWQGPLIMYLFYSVWVAYKIWILSKASEDQIRSAVRSLQYRFLLNFGLTALVTIPFTISDLLQTTNVYQPQWYYRLSIFILSLWGFIDSMYIWASNPEMKYQLKVKLGIFSEGLEENEQSLQLQNRGLESMMNIGRNDSGEYFFQGELSDSGTNNPVTQQLLQMVNKTQL